MAKAGSAGILPSFVINDLVKRVKLRFVHLGAVCDFTVKSAFRKQRIIKLRIFL